MPEIKTAEISKSPPPAAPQAQPQPRVLSVGRFALLESAYATFSVTLPAGWTIEDALKPEFWALNCHKLSSNQFTNTPDLAGAKIEVRTEDHAFYAELYVRVVQERGLDVSILREPVYFGVKEIPDNDKFVARWNVGKRGFDIIRKSDREIVADGIKIKTREAANEWIEKSLRN